jgi:archaellum component FlaC
MKPLTPEEQLQLQLECNHLKEKVEELEKVIEKMSESYNLNFEKLNTVIMNQEHELTILRSQVNALNGNFA